MVRSAPATDPVRVTLRGNRAVFKSNLSWWKWLWQRWKRHVKTILTMMQAIGHLRTCVDLPRSNHVAGKSCRCDARQYLKGDSTTTPSRNGFTTWFVFCSLHASNQIHLVRQARCIWTKPQIIHSMFGLPNVSWNDTFLWTPIKQQDLNIWKQLQG